MDKRKKFRLCLVQGNYWKRLGKKENKKKERKTKISTRGATNFFLPSSLPLLKTESCRI